MLRLFAQRHLPIAEEQPLGALFVHEMILDVRRALRAMDCIHNEVVAYVREAQHVGQYVLRNPTLIISPDASLEHHGSVVRMDRDEVGIQAEDLLKVPQGEISEAGLRWNIDVGLQYLAAWLQGNGCVPIYNLMEDAATREISRAQVWQWAKHAAKLSDGRAVTMDLVRQAIAGELEKLRQQFGTERFESMGFNKAAEIYEGMMTSKDFPEFLTVVAYDHID